MLKRKENSMFNLFVMIMIIITIIIIFSIGEIFLPIFLLEEYSEH